MHSELDSEGRRFAAQMLRQVLKRKEELEREEEEEDEDEDEDDEGKVRS